MFYDGKLSGKIILNDIKATVYEYDAFCGPFGRGAEPAWVENLKITIDWSVGDSWGCKAH